MEEPKKDTKAILLKEAEKKPVRKFVQYDVFTHAERDDVMNPDRDGDTTSWGITDELRNTDCIRLQFTPDTSPLDVLKALKKIGASIERDISFSFKEKFEGKDNLPF